MNTKFISQSRLFVTDFDDFVLHIYAALAEQEAKLISGEQQQPFLGRKGRIWVRALEGGNPGHSTGLSRFKGFQPPESMRVPLMNPTHHSSTMMTFLPLALLS